MLWFLANSKQIKIINSLEEELYFAVQEYAILTLGLKRPGWCIKLSLQCTQRVCMYIGLCILTLQQHYFETSVQRKLFFEILECTT